MAQERVWHKRGEEKVNYRWTLRLGVTRTVYCSVSKKKFFAVANFGNGAQQSYISKIYIFVYIKY